MKIIYRNKEGGEIVLGQTPPFVITKKSGFGAVENEISTQKQYGLDGEFLVNQRLQARDIEIDGQILADDVQDLVEKRIQLSSVLNPSLAGSLSYQTDDGRSFSIDVLVEEAPKMDDNQVNATQTYSLKFTALDPYWADDSNADKLIRLSSVTPTFIFPLIITDNYTFSKISAGIIKEIDNVGDVVVGMTISIEVNGNVTNPKILNVLTQELFGFSGTYTAGTTLKIVTMRGDKEVTKTIDGVETNAMSERMENSSFLQLAKGSNFLVLQADAGAENVIVSISFSPLVIGV